MTLPGGITVGWKRARATRASEYVIRFVFGGLVCAAAGVIASAFGPAVGGLFLAFPAILPASLTLVAKHSGSGRAAGADALGSAVGSVGLGIFAVIVWAAAARASGATMLLLASAGWLAGALLAWAVFEVYRRHRRRHPIAAPALRARCRG